MAHTRKWLVLLAGLTAPILSCSSEATDDDEVECDAEGRCDTVPKTPCDGIMVDKSGNRHKRVAGRRNDPLAKAVFRKGTSCPTTFADIMQKLRENDKENCEGERDGISTRMISETAQASEKATSYRAVTSRTCGDRDTHSILFSSFGIEAGASKLPKGVEIIAFDDVAGVFNYYETDGNTLNFFGTSKDMLKGAGSSGDRRCAECHTGGGLIMKELDTPWLHWEGHRDTPGVAQLIEKHKDFGEQNSGAEFEGVVKSGNEKWNVSRLAHLKATAKVEDMLRPLFCTVEINLDNGADFDSPVMGGSGGSEINDLPFDSLLDPRLKSFGGISIEFADYDAQIKANGQTLPGVTGAIDTVFDYVFVERSHADNNFVDALVADKIIDEGFAKDVVMVDFTRPVFSEDRCALVEFAPDIAAADITPARVRDGFIKNLKAEEPVAGSPAAVLLANLEAKTDTDAHDAKVDAFVAACTALGSKPLVQNALAITSLNREKARQLPIMEFESTMPRDNQTVDANARLHPTTCQLVSAFVAP